MYFIIQCAKEARACIETRANTSSALCDSTLYFHSAIGLGENNCILIIQATLSLQWLIGFGMVCCQAGQIFQMDQHYFKVIE